MTTVCKYKPKLLDDDAIDEVASGELITHWVDIYLGIVLAKEESSGPRIP